MVIPVPLRIAPHVLPDGLEKQGAEEQPPDRGDEQLLVGRPFEQRFNAIFIESREHGRVPQAAQGPEPPLAGPSIGERPEIGVAQIVDIPAIGVSLGVSHVRPPVLQTDSPLLGGPLGHPLRQQIRDPYRHRLIPHKKRRIPPESSPVSPQCARCCVPVISDGVLVVNQQRVFCPSLALAYKSLGEKRESCRSFWLVPARQVHLGTGLRLDVDLNRRGGNLQGGEGAVPRHRDRRPDS
jgi:hypothetical protein